MSKLVKRLKELTAEEQKKAGGKGGMLANMIQHGYPVPDGLVIMPASFENDMLTNAAWRDVQALLSQFRGKSNTDFSFAIRSSALSEDSAAASFAGEFKTILNAITDEEIYEAITKVYQSRLSERVKAYSAAHQLDNEHEMAVVVQQMVEADLSGVLFTADPVNGSYQNMVGNYVYGLGENLVSGEADAEAFSIKRPKGKYSGPEDLKQYARQLFKYASKLERKSGKPQDIEWSVAGNKLYLLQSRPITTLTAGNLDTYDINESFTADSLWVNTNIAEAVPDVITPLSWSITRSLDLEVGAIPGYYIWSGNICGRVYSNIGQRFSAIVTIGVSLEAGRNLLGQIFGKIPEQIDIPLYPFSFKELMSHMLPRVFYTAYKMLTTSVKLNRLIAENPGRCRNLTAKIKEANSPKALREIWDHELAAYNIEAWWIHTSGAAKLIGVLTLQNKLIEMSDDDIAADLMSNLRGEAELASLELVAGAHRVAKGEQTLEEYLNQYGHRGHHEFELALPQPSEDPGWIQKQIEEYRVLDIDIEAILSRQQQKFMAAKEKFSDLNPGKEKWLNKRLRAAAEAAQRREICRSEWTRVYRINRAFALKAGELTGLADDIFFLYKDELIDLLAGNKAATSLIPDRKKNYESYQTLAPFPPIIRGRFDPFMWAKDPMRRTDFYDPNMPLKTETAEDKLIGIAGAAGRVEGKARIILKPEDSDKLQPDEILVAATTNVGWTPLFPKAAAVITDIGAPLSHAAIVARELGIPAVVGCGNATTVLKNGDRVIVDGGRGEVQILK